MKNIIKIMKKDFKNIMTNWAALVIVLGVIGIPSLYSLINIFASWDPYSSTSGIRVAVVNDDQGTVFKEKEINLGNELVDKLKDNDQMGWEFVDKETADNGLLIEEYYAVIVIPEDFSKDTTTLVEKNVKKPKLIYTANEKKNPIAPKFTDSAVKTVKSQLDENIKKTVSGIIFRACNEIGIDIQDNRSSIRKIIDEIYELDDDMPKLGRILDGAVDGTINAEELMIEVQKIIPIVDDVSSAGEVFISDNMNKLDDIQSELDELEPDIKEKLVNAEEKLDSLSVILGNLNENIMPEAAKKTLMTALDTTDAMQKTVQETRDYLKGISKALNKIANIKIPRIDIDEDKEVNENVQHIIDQYNKQIDAIESMQESLKKFTSIISTINNRLNTIDDKLEILSTRINDKIIDLDSGEKLDAQFLTDTIKLVNEIHDLTADVIDNYSVDMMKDINDEIDLVRNVGDNALTLLKQGNSLLPDVDNILSTFMNAADKSHDELVKLQNDFPDMQDKVHKIALKIKEFDDKEDIDDILDMITNDWQVQSDFLASPVEIEDNRLYPWPNYGSTATPFYTVLCLWIGGYMLSILLGTEAHAEDGEEEYKHYEIYFGKMSLFIIIGIFQAIVASMGALFLLKVYAVHPVMFVFFSIFVSVAFMTIIYTAVSLFGHGGIVIGIILLVIQVTASSANFPIEVNPKIFQLLYPYLPFSYAINGMRQIMTGIVYSILFKDIAILVVYMVVSLIIGIIFKKSSNKITKRFVDKLKESKLVI